MLMIFFYFVYQFDVRLMYITILFYILGNFLTWGLLHSGKLEFVSKYDQKWFFIIVY